MTTPEASEKKGMPLHWQIAISLILALVISAGIKMAGAYPGAVADPLISVCEFVGSLFMNALKMIVIPVIVSSIIFGMFSMGSGGGFGRIGAKTLGFYILSSFLAIIVGLALVNLIRPGEVDAETASAILGQAAEPDAFLKKVEGRGTGDLVDIFLRMVPENVFKVTTENSQLLSVITASLFIGFFLNRLPERLRENQKVFWEGIHEGMIGLTNFIIKFAPIGVFGLVLPIFFRTGTELIAPLAWFFATVLLALAFHFFVTMGLLLKFLARVNPLKHFKTMESAVFTAFSTASSAATIPVTMDCLEEKAGISNRVASFTIPLGATVNMDGTALYECIVVLFIAQFYSVVGNFEIDFAMQFTVVVLALLTSVGVAGIPSASLVAITVILGAVGLPLESIGLVIAVDRILDMCRTSVNVFGDSVGAIVVARSEGEKTAYVED